MNIKKYISAAIAATVFGSIALIAVPAFAQTAAVSAVVNSTVKTPTSGHSWKNGTPPTGGMRGAMMPGVFGTVSAINGTTLTVNGHSGFGSTTSATTTYTVNASGATVKKNNATSTVSSIAVGDSIFAQGTVSGTSVTATMIRDGVMTMRGGNGGMHPGGQGSSTPYVSPITGNGQPVIAGTVSSVNGSTVTITNKSNVQYTVDTTNAKIVEGQNTIAISGVVVGDNVVVQGTVNGNAVTASSVIDEKSATTANTTSGQAPQGHQGIFGSIGQFFMHIFGF